MTANSGRGSARADQVPVSPSRARFARLATRVSDATGSAWTFAVALCLIVAWVATGPLFGFSDTWQLIMNTVSSIVTFLMVFLIQNTQNRDAKATQLKLDELIRAVEGARNAFIAAEEDPEEHLDHAKRTVVAEKHSPSEAPRDGEPARGSERLSSPAGTTRRRW